MRWYISGPMTGLPDLNRSAFAQAAALIRAAGHTALNPAELCPLGITWKGAMQIDLAALKTADGVLLLPNWEQSRGARIEVWWARRHDLEIWAFDAGTPSGAEHFGGTCPDAKVPFEFPSENRLL